MRRQRVLSVDRNYIILNRVMRSLTDFPDSSYQFFLLSHISLHFPNFGEVYIHLTIPFPNYLRLKFIQVIIQPLRINQ